MCFIFHFLSLAPTTLIIFFFFFNDTATTEISPFPLHDALPISDQILLVEPALPGHQQGRGPPGLPQVELEPGADFVGGVVIEPLVAHEPALEVFVADDEGQLRSEEHTSELQSQSNLVCRLLLEK